ncbi:MAG: histidine--tRNA ligase [Flavobacteriales bacterium]|nr:histidine--tRNA ligase [Flavobacteriales bacterium]
MKPSIPKGTRDFTPQQVVQRNYLKSILTDCFQRFGFQPIETPSFEKRETLMGKYGEEGDRLIFKILNSGEKVKKADLAALEKNDLKQFSNSLSEKALRYDLTVPFARFVAQHQNELVFPFRRFQIQNVWRADRPQHGRFQEFTQCDADIVGEKSLYQEVEMLQLYDTVFTKLGLTGVTLKINNRKILAGIAALLDASDRLVPFTVSLDKLDKIGREGVEKELLGKGFDPEALARLAPLFELEGTADEKLNTLASLLETSEVGQEGIAEIQFILTQLKSNPLAAAVDLNVTLARGLDYYTGLIVEVAAPEGVKMGSIGGGGRYDDLTSSFGLKDKSGIGISFGFDRIGLVLEELDLYPNTVHSPTQLLVSQFEPAANPWSLQLIHQLREAGMAAEFYPTTAKFKKQLSYANQKQIPWVVICAIQEFEQREFVLKNMTTGEESRHSMDVAFSVIQNELLG